MSVRCIPWIPIAEGGMAEIWLGILEGAADFKRPVVMKRVRAGGPLSPDLAREALLTEARISARLSHPNIVHSYALVEVGTEPYLAMEYLAGVSLRQIVNKTRLPAAVALRILADAARGLDHAHRWTEFDGTPAPVVHGDVSPENLVVTEQGITKLVDFGVARAPGDVGSPLGKEAYASPEQARGEVLAPSSDVFSLGAVAHEALSGMRLFARGDPRETTLALLGAPIADLPPSVDPVARDTVRRMLVRAPSQRTLSMDSIANSFEALSAAQGAGHRDVAIFLQSEFGPLLQARRTRLREILSLPRPESLGTRLTTSSTTVAVAGLLDVATSDAPREHRSLADDDPET